MLNYYLKQKVAIVSPKPQTTRHRILGVLTQENAQVMFLDTPGLHEPEHALGRYMLEAAKGVIEEADLLVTVIDARAGVTDADQRVFAQVKRALGQSGPGGRERKAILVINKADAVKKPKLLPVLDRCAKLGLFTDCIPVSALTGLQMDVVLSRIIAELPEGPRWYEPEQQTDQTDSQRLSELIREQILAATREEVPHAVAVMVEEVEETGRTTKIQATIVVERQGQKAILIGRGGEMLKQIGQQARAEIERLLGRKVFLGLWVKVAEDWRRDARMLRRLGYSGMEPG